MITASAPDRVVVYIEEESSVPVTVKNTGTAPGDVAVSFGPNTKTETLQPAQEKTIGFPILGDVSKEVRLEAISRGETILSKNVKVEVREFQLVWQNTVFQKGRVAVPYEIIGSTSGAMVSETLVENTNRTNIFNGTGVHDLPANGTISATLDAGTYTACVGATNAKGSQVVSGCSDVVVREGLSGAVKWFALVIAGVAALLLFF